MKRLGRLFEHPAHVLRREDEDGSPAGHPQAQRSLPVLSAQVLHERDCSFIGVDAFECCHLGGPSDDDSALEERSDDLAEHPRSVCDARSGQSAKSVRFLISALSILVCTGADGILPLFRCNDLCTLRIRPLSSHVL